jgi:hypothetical protein
MDPHCFCKPKRQPVHKKLKADTPIATVFKDYAFTNAVIPKGTRCVLITEGGTAGKFFVDEFGWVPPRNALLLHDATHYGIVIDGEAVE